MNELGIQHGGILSIDSKIAHENAVGERTSAQVEWCRTPIIRHARNNAFNSEIRLSHQKDEMRMSPYDQSVLNSREPYWLADRQLYGRKTMKQSFGGNPLTSTFSFSSGFVGLNFDAGRGRSCRPHLSRLQRRRIRLQLLQPCRCEATAAGTGAESYGTPDTGMSKNNPYRARRRISDPGT